MFRTFVLPLFPPQEASPAVPQTLRLLQTLPVHLLFGLSDRPPKDTADQTLQTAHTRISIFITRGYRYMLIF